MSSRRREYWIIFLYTLVKDGETSWQHPFLPPVKVKHRPVFGRTQQGGFLSVAASNYRQTANIKENPSYSWEGSLCLCSHDAPPSDAAALVNNWKAACCSFSNWTALQTSPAPHPSLVCLASFVSPPSCNILCVFISEVKSLRRTSFLLTSSAWLQSWETHPYELCGNNLSSSSSLAPQSPSQKHKHIYFKVDGCFVYISKIITLITVRDKLIPNQTHSGTI